MGSTVGGGAPRHQGSGAATSPLLEDSMKRRYEATGVVPRKNHLTVYVTLHIGTAVRFVEIKVPWELLADQQEGIGQGMERVFLRRLKEDADVLYLPLESWE